MKQDKNKKDELVEMSVDDIPKGASLSFDNDGNIVFKNRAFRRKTTSLFPKSSQLRKKGKRKKNK